MEISRRPHAGAIELTIEGRLDSYWADHLDSAIAAIVREGHDRLRLDLSRTTFLSSAGVAVLMKYYKQLLRINGSIVVVEASEAVRLVLDMTRITPLLAPPPQQEAAAPHTQGRAMDRPGARFEIFDLSPGASLTCRTIGNGAVLGSGHLGEGQPVACHPSLLAVGIGAIGSTHAECCDRFGDLLAAGGAIIYQPADGTNVPDYLIGGDGSGEQSAESSDRAPEARLLYGLACEGPFAAFARFDATSEVGAVGLSDLAGSCLEIAGGSAAGVVLIAEASGLVGAVLRRFAASAHDGSGAAESFFAHPRVRDRLLFTAERAFAQSVVLVVGIVAKADVMGHHPQCRPVGGDSDLVGHFHAAAFAFRPFRKGRLDLGETLATLFESERVLGVLHLLHDDRAPGGVGQSEFIRGACWTAPIHTWT